MDIGKIIESGIFMHFGNWAVITKRDNGIFEEISFSHNKIGNPENFRYQRLNKYGYEFKKYEFRTASEKDPYTTFILSK
ncbi:MAG: hypothetical protein AABW81_03020 [Nanoarchaeota archaeon]